MSNASPNAEPGSAGSGSAPLGTPEKTRVLIDPEHPEAGNGGVVPPVETRFKPGKAGGPGRPRGAWPRAALARDLAKGWQSDVEAEGDEDRIGEKARQLAREMFEAALAGNSAKVNALAELINQVEGKPQERVEHSGTQGRTVVVTRDSAASEPELPT